MFEALFSRITAYWVHNEHLLEKIFAGARDAVKLLVIEMEATLDDLGKDFLLCLPLEGQVATYQGVQDNTA